MRPGRSLLAAVAPIVLVIGSAAGDAPRGFTAGPVAIDIRSAETATSFPIYTGSGEAIHAPEGPMAGIIVAKDAAGKTSNYLRAAVTAENGRTLVKVRVDVRNTGKAPVALRLGDITATAPGAVLMAIGEGEHAFTKDTVTLEKLRASTRTIPPGQQVALVYVFSVKTDGAPGKLAYKGKQSIDLKGVATPAG
jgi:hypothetical protein